jgi:hypothetical protein
MICARGARQRIASHRAAAHTHAPAACLLVRGVADVEELAAQREDAVVVAADDGETGDGKRFRRVSLCEDERALVAVAPARLVGVVQLGDARQAAALGAVRLLQLLGLLERRPGQDVLHHARLHNLRGECALSTLCRSFVPMLRCHVPSSSAPP